MKVEYMGFVGFIEYDMDEDVYRISGQNDKGNIATAESAALGGTAPFGIVLDEFRKSVSMCL